MTHNFMSDWTPEEKNRLNGLLPYYEATTSEVDETFSLTESFDWREVGGVVP